MLDVLQPTTMTSFFGNQENMNVYSSEEDKFPAYLAQPSPQELQQQFIENMQQQQQRQMQHLQPRSIPHSQPFEYDPLQQYPTTTGPYYSQPSPPPQSLVPDYSDHLSLSIENYSIPEQPSQPQPYLTPFPDFPTPAIDQNLDVHSTHLSLTPSTRPSRSPSACSSTFYPPSSNTSYGPGSSPCSSASYTPSSPGTTSFHAPSPPTTTITTTSSSSSRTTDLTPYGIPHPTLPGTWTCAYPTCTSTAIFTRGCDLRKHYKRHTKSFFCAYPECRGEGRRGFSSRKDLARHEARHRPGVECERGCGRVFSRRDNMRDHVKRIHGKGKSGSAALGSWVGKAPK